MRSWRVGRGGAAAWCASLIAGPLALAAPAADGAEPFTNRDEVRAIVSEMLADADSRSSLLDDGVEVTHDGTRFKLSSADGQFTLRPLGEIQFRYIVSLRDGDDEADGFGFQARRTRVRLTGTVAKNFLYNVVAGFGRATGRNRIDDAWAGYRTGNWRFRWGQFKAPFLREELVSGRFQLAVERSLTNEVFTQNFTQGVDARWRGEDVAVTLAFTDGFNAQNTAFTDDKSRPFQRRAEADWAGTARVEWKPVGGWSAFRTFTSPPGTETALLFGAAFHAEGGDGGDGQWQSFHATADLSFAFDGFSAFGAFVWRRGDPSVGPITDDFGVIVQAAAYLPDTDWELFARYDVYIPDHGRDGNDPFNSLTAGANWYINGQAMRFTMDAVYFFDDATGSDFGSITSSSVVGFVGSSEPGQVLLRAQFQLLF